MPLRSRPCARVPALLVLALLATGSLVGCGGGGGAGTGSGSAGPSGAAPLVAAPEPARAPVSSVPPAGRVLPLGGGRPEGMVADPRSGLVAVALREPNRLALLDPRRGRVVRTFPVPGSARHLELAPGGGAVLVPGEDTDLVTRVELPSGRAGAPVKVGRQPHDTAVTSDGTQYVADEAGGSVSVLRDGRVVKTFPGLLQPGGAAGNGDTGAVVDVRSRFTSFYRDGEQVARLLSGAGPTHALALGAAGVLVTDTTGGVLYRFSTTGTPRELERVPLPGRPYGTAYDARRHRAWITATERSLLVEYDVTSAGLRQVATFPTVRDAYSVAVDEASGRVVLASEIDSTLQVIQP